ncbi:unnamed protein product [Mytilus coruscus]|uniref:Uncharacterized protein n=1 Tax=Mytilus coruscus TaxID=42192 RepID=A0A6J8C6H1_MYTCO|nr:unnamed protein product [Mytilus coruscus]
MFDDYNPAIPPNYNNDEPLTVEIQVYILSIDSMSDLSKDFAMSIFLRQRWKDKRLKYDRIPGVPALQLNTKISGTFSCDVDLLKYPLDNQICPLIIESYGYTSETLVLQWYEEAVEKKEDIILSQFSLDCIKTFKCDKQYAGMNFSCVQMNIKLDRLYDYYLLQIYVPSILVVILSWVSFWISVDATPARISLGLLTVLAMTTQSSGLPKVSYFKAIDVWMVSCLCFVFAALIEFAYVNVLSRVEQRRQSHVVDITNNKTENIRRNLPEKVMEFCLMNVTGQTVSIKLNLLRLF